MEIGIHRFPCRYMKNDIGHLKTQNTNGMPNIEANQWKTWLSLQFVRHITPATFSLIADSIIVVYYPSRRLSSFSALLWIWATWHSLIRNKAFSRKSSEILKKKQISMCPNWVCQLAVMSIPAWAWVWVMWHRLILPFHMIPMATRSQRTVLLPSLSSNYIWNNVELCPITYFLHCMKKPPPRLED